MKVAAVTALALLGPLLGVATEIWPQAVLLLGLALLLIIAPPRRAPNAALCVIFTAILGLSLMAFMPAHWFAVPEWRRVLVKDFRIELPGTLSPQPWLSLHAVCLMFGGLVFALYLSALTWGPQSRRQAARWFAAGITLLALVALVSVFTGWRPPFWPKVLNAGNGFGIFPNRNQTANVLALAAVMVTALAFDAFGKRRVGGWFWVASLLVLGAAIVQAYSRAGVLLFFGGIGAWVLLSLSVSRSEKRWSVAIAGLALLLTAFFIFGGGTFDRIRQFLNESRADYRVEIQSDALRLAAAAPWTGQGIGNFAPVFAMAREASADQNRAIHPESDWLWAAVEMGWPVAALFAAALLLWVWKCFPLSQGTDRALRGAGLVCGIAFALHAFADVSGHRPGTAWPALFLAGLALKPGRMIAESRMAALAFRLLGVVIAAISGWWLAATVSVRVAQAAPTPATASRLLDRAKEQAVRGEHAAAVSSATEALRIAPLNADAYFQRALARVAEGFSVWGAGWDFATARYLEPRWARLCFEEGKAWSAAGQNALARDAWLEALRRAGDKAPLLYREMLEQVRSRPGMQAMLGALSRGSPEYFLIYLWHTGPLERQSLIDQLIAAQPKLQDLSGPQRREFFSIWFRGGNHARLFSTLVADADFRREGWPLLAKLHAERLEFESACRTAREFCKRPAMPTIVATRPMAELERLFRLRPDDFDIGLQLHSTLLATGRRKEALDVLKALQTVRNHPAYLAFIEAEVREEMSDWEGAWDAWLRYGGKDFE